MSYLICFLGGSSEEWTTHQSLTPQSQQNKNSLNSTIQQQSEVISNHPLVWITLQTKHLHEFHQDPSWTQSRACKVGTTGNAYRTSERHLNPDFRDDMPLPKRRKIRTLALLFCVISFTTFLFSYTFRDPSLYFFKYAFRLSDTIFSKGLCACQRCMTELEDDPWFSERFNQSFSPLMSRENSLLSDETFKWWQVRFEGICFGGSCNAVLKEIAHSASESETRRDHE